MTFGKLTNVMAIHMMAIHMMAIHMMAIYMESQPQSLHQCSVAPLERKIFDKSKRKRVTLSSLWWQVETKISVRIRRRVGECKEMEEKEKESVHPLKIN